jgi:hypothetical protein
LVGQPEVEKVTRSIGLPTLVGIWLLAEAYQFFFGAITSIQVAAPGVGMRASWAPNWLVAESITLLPLGFVLCLWGNRIGRLVVIACGLAMIGIGVAAAAALSRDPMEALTFFALMAPPWLSLLGCLRLRRVRSTA